MACTTVYERGEKACSRAHGTAVSRWQLACVCLSVVAITLSLFTLFWVQKIVQDLEQHCGCEARKRAEEGLSASVTSVPGSSGLPDVAGTPDTDPDTIQLEEEEDEEHLGGQSRIKRSKGNRDNNNGKLCKRVKRCMRNDTDTYGFFDALTVIREFREEVKEMLTRSYVHHSSPGASGPGNRTNVSKSETVLSVKVASKDDAERSGNEGMTTVQGGGVYLVYGQLTYSARTTGTRSWNGQSILVISDDQKRNPPRFLSCMQRYPAPEDYAPSSCFTAGVVSLQEGMTINLTASAQGEIFIDQDKTFLGAVNLAALPPDPSDGG